jgi:hypothetical protein
VHRIVIFLGRCDDQKILKATREEMSFKNDITKYYSGMKAK